ncbi:hypothetical protein TXIAM_220186 [Tenacibaculum xiamenense]
MAVLDLIEAITTWFRLNFTPIKSNSNTIVLKFLPFFNLKGYNPSLFSPKELVLILTT